jgi:hypothetical protein
MDRDERSADDLKCSAVRPNRRRQIPRSVTTARRLVMPTPIIVDSTIRDAT